jgi:methylphosphotriester-DNA--protein-cysteine methyltransferase
MPYFVFDAAAPQARKVKKLSEYLQAAQDIAEEIAAQNGEMSAEQMRAQFGVPVDLDATDWVNQITGVAAALSTAGVTNITVRMGFNS